MKKRVLSMFMALALCLTLLPAPAWAAEADAPEGGTIVQEEQQEKAPAAESPAILEQAAENGIAAQNGEDGVSVQSGGDGIAVQAASAEKTESSVASVVIDGKTNYYNTLNEAIAAAYNANNDAPLTVTMLNDVAELNNSNSSPRSSATIEMGGKSLGYLWFLNKTLTLKNGVIQGHTHLRSGGGLLLTAPAGAAAAIDGSLNIAYISGEGSGTAKVSGAKIGVKGTLSVENSAAGAVVISGSDKAVDLSKEATLFGCRLYGSTEENGSPDTVAVYDADQKTYTVNGVTAKTLVSGPTAVVAVTPGDTLSVMAGEAQEYTAQFTAEGVVTGSVKGLGDLQATVENGDANGITVNVAENAADGTWKVTVQTAESTPLGTYTLNLSSAVDGAVSGSVQFKVSETKYAASVDGTNYRSLSAAIDAAKKTNGTVTLLDNVTDSITVTDGAFTIDLNGKTWTGASGSRALTVNGGEVTLSSTGGAGTIVGSDTTKFAVQVDSGTVHLKENVTLSDRIYIADQNGGSVTFEPGVTVAKNIMTRSHSVVRFLDGLALMDLGKTGYVPFYNRNTQSDPFSGVVVVAHPAHHMVDGVCDQCGYVCGHANAKAGDTTCPDCGAAFIADATAADGTVTRYTNADAALAAAAGNAKVTFVPGTYTLKNAVSFSGRIETEIDLNGATLQYASGDRGVVFLITEPYENITITLKNGTVQNTGEGTGIGLYSTTYGSARTVLTLEDVTVIGGVDTFNTRQAAVNVANRGNTLTVKSGSFSGPLDLNLANNTVKLYGGTYQNGITGSMYRDEKWQYELSAKDYAALLDNSDPAKQYAYADGTSSVITYDEVAARMNDRDDTNNSIQVVEHTHTMGDANTCTECGFVCTAHKYENGVCAICHAECPHTDATCNAEVWTCNACGLKMVAKVETGGTTTYTTDLGTTLYEAADGTKITLLANAAVGTVNLKGKTVTLDLNGKTVKNSGRDSAPIRIGTSSSSAKLIITGSGSFTSAGQPVVVENGTLDLSQWTGDNSFIQKVTISGANSRFISPTGAGKIDRLVFTGSDTEHAADTASLNGGRYDVIVYKHNKTIKLGDLLAEGYAFRQNGTFLEYASKLESNGTVEEVEVVPCPHADAKDGKCLYCGKDGILARVGDTTYDDVGKAVKGWLANGGTLTLYDNAPIYSNGNDVDFSSGSNNPFIIDLNGFRFNYAGAAITLNGGKSLTIKDSREKESSNGAFGPLVADNGTLTLESGYLQKLTVPSDSLATILLKGGKVSALACPVPVFNLLGNGYCLMSGNITVDPTTILNSGTGTYTIKNPQPLITADKKNGSSSKGERKIPFTLSLKANDSEVGRMQFKWYFIKEDGTTALLAESEDVTATNDVFTYDATTQSKVVEGWDDTDLKVRNKPYDVICVVAGKDSNGAYLWQTPLRGYKLTIAPTDLSELMNQGKLTFTQVEDTPSFGEPFKGNIKDGKGTFVFEPYGGDVNNASTLTYCFEVSHDGQKLEKDKDYTIEGGNTAQYAGAHTLTIQGMGSYTGTATHTWRIEPYQLTRENYDPPTITKVYDGTTGFDFSKDGNWGSFKENVAHRPNDAKTGKNPILGGDTNAISIYLKPEDLKASAVTLDSPDVGDRTASYTITLKARDGQSEPNFVFEDGEPPTIQVTAPAYITKAFLSSSPEAGELNVANDHAGVYTLDLSKLLPALEAPREYGAVTYGAPAVNLPSGYYAVSTAKIENGKLILPIQAVKTDKTGSIGSVEVKVSTTNYHDFTLTINVNATNKIVPTGEPTLSAKTLTYGQALSAIELSGKLHDNVNNKDVEGTFTWADGTVKPNAGSYEAAWKFTPTDGNTYAETTGTVNITVNKAKPTGDPIYTRITAANKTLKDAALKPNTSWPTGTIQWVDKDGKVLPDTTEVKANTEYTWSFTPADTANYNGATGELTLYSVSTGGGGGGGSSSGSTVKTDTVTNPDGSVTKTETKKDGTVIETTTGKDGSTTKTEKKDGSSVTENKAADGSTGTVKTDKHGQTTAETTLSSKAVEDAKKNGEAVKAPVEVEASRDSNTAPTVKIELPRNSGDTKVEIPVTNVKPGTVAVLVHPDGTEEIVKNSLPTEDGIQLTINGGATVKIVDNSKDFADTRNHWAKDAIDFVSARGLVNGMSATIYAPNASTTRAQLWTILARQNDADLTGGANWYEKAQAWAKEKGISDGANPNGTINRAQMVTMLWRAMGQPAAGGNASFADVPADSYYAQAVAWAVENGITTGVGDGRFDPNSTCTRAQIATFLWRAMAE